MKNLFGNDPVKVVMIGGASLLIAAVLTQFVQEPAEANVSTVEMAVEHRLHPKGVASPETPLA